ncbi:MAG: hypothetical protein ABI837_16600 [Acidobacteriota bacterium]
MRSVKNLAVVALLLGSLATPAQPISDPRDEPALPKLIRILKHILHIGTNGDTASIPKP